jgi:FKBP-type peptidyl-prolyl cis-trans isomerase 2
MIAKNDFIEIDYTGRTADDNAVFDTTVKSVADENHLHSHNLKPVIICVGEGQLLKSLDENLIGKDIGEHMIKLTAEQAFGKKSAKLIQLVSTSKFVKEKIQPMPGLQVTIDGMNGLVRTVTGGRTMVDFNHPLASRDLVYTVTIKRIVTDAKEKAESLLAMVFPDVKTDLAEGVLNVTTKAKLPEELHKMLEERVKKLVPEIISVTFGK